MKTQVKDKLHNYLPHRLLITSPNGIPYILGELKSDGEMTCENGMYHANGKPHLRSLSDLIKPITVEGYNNGEPFVPLRHLSGYEGVFEFVDCFKVPHGEWVANYKTEKGERLQFGLPFTLRQVYLDIAEKLFSWHFWIWDEDVFNKGHAVLIS